MSYAICPKCNANLAAGALHATTCQFAAACNIGDGPVELRHAEHMRELARALDIYLNPQRIDNAVAERTTGFVLIVTSFDEGARCNYMSNVQREDVIAMLTEQLARFRGMPSIDVSTRQ